ncbi:hypothetical protein H477_0249 [[Clostridium] sordellii ATCC 9714]|nr:hypothetical protein H477_0249 [[Clostridium] sordellii ATCC 9714] [Paeniclostridium sordellii ATCC 9714]
MSIFFWTLFFSSTIILLFGLLLLISKLLKSLLKGYLTIPYVQIKAVVNTIDVVKERAYN